VSCSCQEICTIVPKEKTQRTSPSRGFSATIAAQSSHPYQHLVLSTGLAIRSLIASGTAAQPRYLLLHPARRSSEADLLANPNTLHLQPVSLFALNSSTGDCLQAWP
jgi:hypothetical protein